MWRIFILQAVGRDLCVSSIRKKCVNGQGRNMKKKGIKYTTGMRTSKQREEGDEAEPRNVRAARECETVVLGGRSNERGQVTEQKQVSAEREREGEDVPIRIENDARIGSNEIDT